MTVQAQPATEFTNKGREHGARRDYETASRVAEVVARVVPNGDWHSRMDDVCEALDKEEDVQIVGAPRTRVASTGQIVWNSRSSSKPSIIGLTRQVYQGAAGPPWE